MGAGARAGAYRLNLLILSLEDVINERIPTYH